jgi:hypothetical protein
MPSLCPWYLHTLEYSGICSHTALADIIHGEEDGLTPEQLAAKQVEMEDRRKEQNRYRHRIFKARAKARDLEGYMAQR